MRRRRREFFGAGCSGLSPSSTCHPQEIHLAVLLNRSRPGLTVSRGPASKIALCGASKLVSPVDHFFSRRSILDQASRRPIVLLKTGFPGDESESTEK